MKGRYRYHGLYVLSLISHSSTYRIVVLAGLGLKTEEFSKAFQRLRFNLFVQVFNFGVDSAVVFGVSRALLAAGALSLPLANGLVVCASLSMTINMVFVLTKSSGGDEASAVFHAAAGNMIGVFLTPTLILGYLGVNGSVDIGEIFFELAIRVVLPIAVGQVIRKISPAVVEWYMKHKQTFKKLQEMALVFIVYTVFCRTFAANAESGSNSVEVVDIVVVIVVEFACLVFLMCLAWVLLRLFFKNEPKLIVMGLFGCTHKTVAMGIPLINAIYEDDANIGLITLPLLIWHTMQLILGSFLAPKLARWVEQEEERLGLTNDEEEEEEVEFTKSTSEPRQLDNNEIISSALDSSNDTTSSWEGKALSDVRATALEDIEQGDSDVESA
jgi:solute carrier family 10 (sodium/bile acid cotransporter), member 7